MAKVTIAKKDDLTVVEIPRTEMVHTVVPESITIISPGPSINVGGSGFKPTYIQESQPQPEPAGATWWNPSTEDLMVVHNGQWRRTSQERLTAGAGLEISSGQIRHNLNSLPRV